MENSAAAINNPHQYPNFAGYKITGAIALVITAIALTALLMAILCPQVAIVASAIAFVKGATVFIASSGTLMAISLLAAIILLKKPIIGASFVGGGVLPYCVENGTAYFLLSQESKGRFKGEWCDFGGARDPFEDPKTTAFREASEESKGLLNLQNRRVLQLSNRSEQYLYYTFFTPFQDRSEFKPSDFADKKVKKGSHQDEKSAVAWVKAQDVYNAVMKPAQKGNSFETCFLMNGQREKIRGSFAMSLRSIYTHDKQLLPTELQFS